MDIAPTRRDLGWHNVARIDAERLWWAMRGLNRGALMQLLARALALVPVGELKHVLGDHLRAGDFGATADEQPATLRIEVERFYELARQGYFYEETSSRGREQSRGTQEFVARWTVALDRCVTEHGRLPPEEVRAALEMLMELLRTVDERGDDIAYFIDESGSWQVGAAWDRALPVYFDCLARTSTEQEYGVAVAAVLADFGGRGNVPRAELRLAAEEAWLAVTPPPSPTPSP
jgi:hypothetical protein